MSPTVNMLLASTSTRSTNSFVAASSNTIITTAWLSSKEHVKARFNSATCLTTNTRPDRVLNGLNNQKHLKFVIFCNIYIQLYFDPCWMRIVCIDGQKDPTGSNYFKLFQTLEIKFTTAVKQKYYIQWVIVCCCVFAYDCKCFIVYDCLWLFYG